MKYDYLIVGAGLFGATYAHEMKRLVRGVLLLTSESIWPVISIQGSVKE